MHHTSLVPMHLQSQQPEQTENRRVNVFLRKIITVSIESVQNVFSKIFYVDLSCASHIITDTQNDLMVTGSVYSATGSLMLSSECSLKRGIQTAFSLWRLDVVG